MPIIDMLAHYGVVDTTRATRVPELAEAIAYANGAGVEMLCLASGEASSDLREGNARLAQVLPTDPRLRGWATLSMHQPELSMEVARQYLTRSAWIGARFEQHSDADAINTAAGYEVLNALRRYGRAVLLTVTTPGTLHAAVAAARDFHALRFIVAPQSEALTADALPDIKETINIALLPVAAYVERDVIAQALAIVGERRVLWASEWGRFHPAAALGMVRDSAINNLQRERITYRNATELLGQ